MALTTHTGQMTIEEFKALEDDGFHYELLRGELLRMAPAGGRHGRVAGRLTARLAAFVYEHDLGEIYIAETGFVLQRDPDVVLVPDSAFVRRDRIPAEDDEIGFVETAPDIVIEVVSPSDRAKDSTAKVSTYLAAGVRLVWQVDPAKRLLMVYAPEEPQTVLFDTDQLDGGDVVPGFSMNVADIFGRSTKTTS